MIEFKQMQTTHTVSHIVSRIPIYTHIQTPDLFLFFICFLQPHTPPHTQYPTGYYLLLQREPSEVNETIDTSSATMILGSTIQIGGGLSLAPCEETEYIFASRSASRLISIV
jgi:hypothetical protein